MIFVNSAKDGRILSLIIVLVSVAMVFTIKILQFTQSTTNNSRDNISSQPAHTIVTSPQTFTE